ncbi:Uncharacterised protein [Klebsiella pneumoniae]|nr:Uncharacterised protein [Klebsiella pneumoniae]SWL02236.1 Uncharacterised protein [Klebsiella pneumoniae]SWT08324.1 Uncharacterised protein [Klebsiella pneumoniae]
MLHNSVHRCIDQFAVHAVFIKHKRRDYADQIASGKRLNILTYGLHNASRFITKTCRKFRLNNILAVAVHDFCTIKTDSLHANLNFTRCWCGHLHIDNFQNFRTTGAVKGNNFRHIQLSSVISTSFEYC